MNTHRFLNILSCVLLQGSLTTAEISITLNTNEELKAQRLRFVQGTYNLYLEGDVLLEKTASELQRIEFPEASVEPAVAASWLYVGGSDLIPMKRFSLNKKRFDISSAWNQSLQIAQDQVSVLRLNPQDGVEQRYLEREAGWRKLESAVPEYQVEADALRITKAGVLKRKMLPYPSSFRLEWTATFPEGQERSYYQLNLVSDLEVEGYLRLGHHLNVTQGQISYQWKSGGTTPWVTWKQFFNEPEEGPRTQHFQIRGDDQNGKFQLYVNDQFLQEWQVPIDQLKILRRSPWLALSVTSLQSPLKVEKLQLIDSSSSSLLPESPERAFQAVFKNGDRIGLRELQINQDRLNLNSEDGVDLELNSKQLSQITFPAPQRGDKNANVEIVLQSPPALLRGTLLDLNEHQLRLRHPALQEKDLLIPIDRVSEIWPLR